MTILGPVLFWLLTVDDQGEEVGGRGAPRGWCPGCHYSSQSQAVARAVAQIPISEQFNIPHQAVSRQIVSLTRAGMLVMITLVLDTGDVIQCFYLSWAAMISH